MHASLLTNVNCTTFFHIFYLQFDSINRIFVVMHKAYYGDAMRMKMIFVTEEKFILWDFQILIIMINSQ